MFLCSNNWVPDEKNGPRAKYEFEPINKFKSKVYHNNNNNNGVPGAAGVSEKLDSSNPISTHSGTGEKETLNKMLWEIKIKIKNSFNIK